MSSLTATRPDRSRPWAPWALVVTAAILLASRLPLLLRIELALDGDESIVGLMALHLLEGKSLPVFFYGQGYGLSLIETGAGAAFFALLGSSATTLRLAMVVLWSIGGGFLAGAAVNLGGRRAGWITTLLVVACPAWLEWSTKARGGYLTAFVLSSLALWAVSGAKPGQRLRWFGVGVCAAGVLFAQAFWLACLLPLMIGLWWGRRERKEAGFFLAGAAAGGLALLAAAARSSYWAPELLRDFEPITSLLRCTPWACAAWSM